MHNPKRRSRLALFLILAFPLAAGGAGAQALPAEGTAARAAIAPDNAGLFYSPYNWLVTPSAAKTVNAGAYFRTRINATRTCQIGLSVGPATPYSQAYARLDGGPWQEYVPKAAGAQTWALTMPSPTTSPNHLLEFVVKSTTETQDRWNGQATAVQFTGLTLDPGATLTLPPARKYRFLLFGDSITEGVRVNGFSGIPNDTDRNDATLDYAYPLGELLDAEVGVVGFGATGMTAGGSGGVPALPASYRQLWSGQARAFSPVPDLVIYNEGTNEPSAARAAMLAAFTKVVQGIGDTGTTNTSAGLNGTRHLILRPFNGAQSANLSAVAASFHSANVVYGDTTGFWSSEDASDGLHPYAYAHLGQIAPQVAALALPLLRPAADGAKKAAVPGSVTGR